MLAGYCACLPRSIFGSQLGIILFHSYLQLIHPQISPDYWAEYGWIWQNAFHCRAVQTVTCWAAASHCNFTPDPALFNCQVGTPRSKADESPKKADAPGPKAAAEKEQTKGSFGKRQETQVIFATSYIQASMHNMSYSVNDSWRQQKRVSARIDGWIYRYISEVFHTALLSRIEASFVCTWRKEPKKLSRSETKAAMPHGVRTNELCVHQHSFYCKMPEKKHDLFMSLHLLSLSHLPS